MGDRYPKRKNAGRGMQEAIRAITPAPRAKRPKANKEGGAGLLGVINNAQLGAQVPATATPTQLAATPIVPPPNAPNNLQQIILDRLNNPDLHPNVRRVLENRYAALDNNPNDNQQLQRQLDPNPALNSSSNAPPPITGQLASNRRGKVPKPVTQQRIVDTVFQTDDSGSNNVDDDDFDYGSFTGVAEKIQNILAGPPFFPQQVTYNRQNRAQNSALVRNNLRSWEGANPGKKYMGKRSNEASAYKTNAQAHANVRGCPFVEFVPGYYRCQKSEKYQNNPLVAL